MKVATHHLQYISLAQLSYLALKLASKQQKHKQNICLSDTIEKLRHSKV